MKQLQLGCVADDFTGAGDAASFLVKGGMRTILISSIPSQEIVVQDCDAVVIALKTRSQETVMAVEDTINACRWLKTKGAKHLFLKYCSTFDSTPKGNIGPIADAIMETYEIGYTVLCPALPVNGRQVKDDILYVNGVLLAESYMKSHPLNPMWDSSISKLMQPQSKYPCFTLSHEKLYRLSKEEIRQELKNKLKGQKHFYVVPDHEDDQDSKRIVEVFGDLPLLTGGSGLMTDLAKQYKKNISLPINYKKVRMNQESSGAAIVLAGSCSKTTLSQIAYFQKSGAACYKLVPDYLRKNGLTEAAEFIKAYKGKPLLIYSSATPEETQEERKNAALWQTNAKLLEQATAYLAEVAVRDGFTRIVVAGGETSGAVTQRLGYKAFYIGNSIAPGIPLMIPTDHPDMRIVLKSGNFGQEDFFLLALKETLN